MRNRKFILLAVLILVLAMALGCKKSETANTETVAATTDTSTSSASTAVSATDTSGTTTTNPMTSSTTGAAMALALSDDDKKFAMKTAEGNLAEASLGGMAASKTTNADVKAFAQRMQTDHTNANNELMAWAKSKGLDLPTQPNAEAQKMSDDLAKKNGAAFDKAYMEAMVKGHDKVVAEFKAEQKKAKDADLKAWVDKTLPTIEDHDKSAHDIAKKLK